MEIIHFPNQTIPNRTTGTIRLKLGLDEIAYSLIPLMLQVLIDLQRFELALA